MTSSSEISFVTLRCFVSWFGRVYIAIENGRNFTEQFWEDIRYNYEQIITKTDFRFLGRKKDRTVDCDAIYFCVFCVSVSYMLTYVHECFIGKEFSYYENGKSTYIEYSYKDTLTIGE